MSDAGNIIRTVRDYNAGREPERLAMKYRAMRQDPFVFMRGTCHLYYRAWPAQDASLNDAPLGWISGDLHLENFGSYKGDNRLVYFDLNDFDEAALAPVSWELSRWICSILVAAESLSISHDEALQLCRIGLDSYVQALANGKARWLERETAKGMIRDLLNPLTLRNRKTFLNGRTRLRKGTRTLKVDGKRALALDATEKEVLFSFMQQYAKSQDNPDFYRPLDAARRIAGTGSLGIARYVILVEGRGSPDGNFLIDLKQAVPSALAPYLQCKQPVWRSEAHRVASVQQWAQAIAPAFLSAVEFRGKPFVLKGLQPTQDRLALAEWNGKFKRLEQVIRSMGQLAAWSHLRSGGRAGAAIADEWVAFGLRRDWQQPLLEYAVGYARQVRRDWQEYSSEYDKAGAEWGGQAFES